MGLFRTHRNWAALFCRIALAAIFIPHGLDKLIRFEPLGWEGPEAWSNAVSTMLTFDVITAQYKVYAAQASAWAEVIAGVACVLGLLVRLAVLPLIADMVVAIILIHGRNGFWLNHTMNGVPAPGFEYCLFIILICLGLFFSGAGSFSLDKLVAGDPEGHEYEEEFEYEELHPSHR
jgi:putative oxidoreductase